jgi:hypothetical protein
VTIADWPEIHRRVLPALPPGTLFDRLARIEQMTILVTGCQRSGTRWLTKLLGATLSDASAPRELDGCSFLLLGHELPLDGISVLVLQTTFANIETASYAPLPERVPVVLLVRNPFSVCWSLVYNWQNLALEYAYRSQTLRAEDRVALEPEPWRMAIELYRQSMRAGMQILRDRPRRTGLLVYDDLIRDVPAGLRALAGFLATPLVAAPPRVMPDPLPPHKHLGLPLPFRGRIAEHGEPLFTQIVEVATELGARLPVGAAPVADGARPIGA